DQGEPAAEAGQQTDSGEWVHPGSSVGAKGQVRKFRTWGREGRAAVTRPGDWQPLPVTQLVNVALHGQAEVVAALVAAPVRLGVGGQVRPAPQTDRGRRPAGFPRFAGHVRGGEVRV